MTESQIKAPAKRPCASCPYRKDVPSGVWHPSEYAKLVAYDQDTAQQPTAVFMCHQRNGCVCSGWAGGHDMVNNLALRLVILAGHMDSETAEAVMDYATSVPLFASGAQAAAHGMRDVSSPGSEAVAVMNKMVRKSAV